MDIKKDFELFEEFAIDNIPAGDLENSPYVFFNNALEKIRQGSDDMAIILLKKAVTGREFIPNCYILLALLLYKNREQREALELIKAVLKKDPDNEMANHYREKLFSTQNKSKGKSKVKEKIKKVSLPAAPKNVESFTSKKNEKVSEEVTGDVLKDVKGADVRAIEKRKKPKKVKVAGKKTKRPSERAFKKTFGPLIIAVVVILAIGGIIGWGIGYGAGNSKNKEINGEISRYQSELEVWKQKVSNLTVNVEELQNTIGDLTGEKEKLNEQIKQKEQEIQAGKIKVTLANIQDMVAKKEYSQAVDSLKEIDLELLSADNKPLYEDLFVQANDNLCTALFNQGMNLYDNGKYKEAYELFSQALETGFETELIAHLNYRAGRCVYEQGQYESSIVYFDIISDEYPEYEFADYSAYYKGRAYQYLGDYDRAKQIFIYAQENFPQSPLKNSINARINELN